MDWYPWHIKKFRIKTLLLDPYQDGCYRRLIDEYMMTRSPLPGPPEGWHRIIGISNADWMEKAFPQVVPYFKKKGDVWHQKTCDKILLEQNGLSRRLSEAGKNGAKKRWDKERKAAVSDSHPNGPPIATPLGSDSTRQDNTGTGVSGETSSNNPPHPPKSKKAEKSGTRLPTAWVLPKSWGDEALAAGLTADQVRTQATLFSNHWWSTSQKNGVKRDWRAAWRKWFTKATEDYHEKDRRNSTDRPTSSQQALALVKRKHGLG